MVQSEIEDFTWPSRRVGRKFGKANSYWPSASCAAAANPIAAAMPIAGAPLTQSLLIASHITEISVVLKRYERVDILREQGKWKEGDRPTGLPKTKSEQ